MVVAIRDTAHNSVIFGSLAEIYTRQTYTDVVFHCADGRTVRAHRLLLSSISPFLQSLCLGQEQFDLVEISTPEINSYDLDNVMRYCYEGLIRLDKEEFPIFDQIMKSLEIKIPNVILKGEGQEEEESENSLVIPVQTQNSGPAKQVALKRKINENSATEVCPKVRKVQLLETQDAARGNMVDFFNQVQDDFRSKQAKQAKPVPSSTSSSGGPILVPLEHFQKMVALVEQRKVERKLEALVDATVRKTMRKIQQGLKSRIEARKLQLSMGFSNKPSNVSVPGQTSIGNTGKDAGNLSRGGASIPPAQKPPPASAGNTRNVVGDLRGSGPSAQKPPPAPTTVVTENIAGSSRGSGSSTPPVERQPLTSVGSTCNVVGNLQGRRPSIPLAQKPPLATTGIRKIVPGSSRPVTLLQNPLQQPKSDTYTKPTTSQNTMGPRNLFPATTLTAPNLPTASTVGLSNPASATTLTAPNLPTASTVGLSNPASATVPLTTSAPKTNSVAPFQLVFAAGKHAIVRAPTSNPVSAASPPKGTVIQASPGLVMRPQKVKTYTRTSQPKSLSKDNTY